MWIDPSQQQQQIERTLIVFYFFITVLLLLVINTTNSNKTQLKKQIANRNQALNAIVVLVNVTNG